MDMGETVTGYNFFRQGQLYGMVSLLTSTALLGEGQVDEADATVGLLDRDEPQSKEAVQGTCLRRALGYRCDCQTRQPEQGWPLAVAKRQHFFLLLHYPWPTSAMIIGEVKWMAKTLRGRCHLIADWISRSSKPFARQVVVSPSIFGPPWTQGKKTLGKAVGLESRSKLRP